MRWLVMILVSAGALFWFSFHSQKHEQPVVATEQVPSHPTPHIPVKRVVETRAALPPKARIPAKPEFKAKFELVDSLLRDKRRADALELLREILKADPRNEKALYELGFFLGEDPLKREEAMGYLTQALEANPNNAGAMGELLALSDKGASQKTIAFVREQYDQNPDSTNLAAGLGRLMMDHGDYPSAILLLEKSASDPYFALSSLSSLLDAYRGSGDTQKMVDTYERLIAVQEEFMSKAGDEEAALYREELEASRVGLAEARRADEDRG